MLGLFFTTLGSNSLAKESGFRVSLMAVMILKPNTSVKKVADWTQEILRLTEYSKAQPQATYTKNLLLLSCSPIHLSHESDSEIE